MPCANNPKEKARKFQRTLYRAAKCNATRRFHALYDKIYREDILHRAWQLVKTNKGKEGIDNQSIQSIEEQGVGEYLTQIREELQSGDYHPKPVLRVYIPKPDGQKRPLGIPTIRDRIVQGAMKIVIEPIFEADFHHCSFGARPKRSSHDANEVIRQTANRGYNWVVDGDIENYFNTIDQEKLMVLVKKRISDRQILKLIRKFLEAGVLEDGEIRSSYTGTPQGGVLSPLLANIYLSYLDKIWKEKCEQVGTLVRFVDDFVVLCKSEEDAKEALRRVGTLMNRLGLKLHSGKTKIVNLEGGQEGFDFLGFHHRKVRSWRYKKYYLQRWPRPKAMKTIRERIRTITRKYRQNLYRSLQEVVAELNPVLRGWGNYFAVGNSSRQFSAVDSYVTERLCLFLSKKKGKTGRGWSTRWKGNDWVGTGLHRLSGTLRRHRSNASAAR